jgi:hypothetical protein
MGVMQVLMPNARTVARFPAMFLILVSVAIPSAGGTLPGGDVNGDAVRNIGDAVYLLSHLFAHGPAPVACGPCAGPDMPAPWTSVRSNGAGTGDINGDGRLNIADPIALLGYLFAHGPEPVPCGTCWPCGPKRLPATGEIGCFGPSFTYIDCNSPESPGQDAYYAIGCPLDGRFVDNGDGTVTDKCTNLMWQKATARPEGSEIYEYKTSWESALKYAEALEFADHDDWRLPNINELVSIIVWQEPPVYPDPDELRMYVPEPFDVPPSWPWSNYWSSTLGQSVLLGHVGYPVDPTCSELSACEGAHIRCVRGGLGPCEARLPATGMDVCVEPDPSLGYFRVVPCDAASFVGQDAAYQAGCPMDGRFVDNGDGTVTDLCTGLMWMQDPAVPDSRYNPDECDGIFWQEALIYAENLDFAGYSDWRLPNVRELLMLGHWAFFDSQNPFPFWDDIRDPNLKRTYPFSFGKLELEFCAVRTRFWTSSGASHTFAYAVGQSPLGVGGGNEDGSGNNAIRCVRGPLWIDER